MNQNTQTYTTRNSIITCTNTSCYRKNCPNYSPRAGKNSFNFPDCIERMYAKKLEQQVHKPS